VEKDIDRINDKVNADARAFDSVRASIIKDIREGDVEQRLKQAESTKLSSNASIQDIISNSIEAYRTQERTQNMEAEDELTQNIVTPESNQNMEAEESLSQEMMSLDVGDIAEIAKIMTEGVEYRTNDGVKVMNGDKIRKLFVKELRKLLKNNEEFEEAFDAQFRTVSQKDLILRNLSTGKEPLFENARQVLQKYSTAKEQSGLDKTINLSGYGQTKIGNDLVPAVDFPEVVKRGFGMKNRQHKHNEELEAQAQLNSMPRVAFQVKKKADQQ